MEDKQCWLAKIFVILYPVTVVCKVKGFEYQNLVATE